MKKIAFLLLTMTALLFAQECRYEAKQLEVDWKAYKTPLKIGVGGTFDKVAIEATDKSSQKSYLQTSTVTINTASINSKNSGRDAKLVKYFFDVQNVKQIKVKVISVEKKLINVDITMNGITKSIPMKLEFDDEIKAEGHIDLADFNMLPSLSSITKACYDLHKGKTWSDVSIGFSTTVEATLCNVEIKK